MVCRRYRNVIYPLIILQSASWSVFFLQSHTLQRSIAMALGTFLSVAGDVMHAHIHPSLYLHNIDLSFIYIAKRHSHYYWRHKRRSHISSGRGGWYHDFPSLKDLNRAIDLYLTSRLYTGRLGPPPIIRSVYMAETGVFRDTTGGSFSITTS